MDIGSGTAYPSCALSNFAPHPFEIDGVQCASMEGFLQSLKFSNPDMQRTICGLVGRAAKRAGRHKNWQRTQILHWQGKKYARNSRGYQRLLDRAYEAMSENVKFRNALIASGRATLTHTIGRTSSRQTVLTRSEFCGRLTRIRAKLLAEKNLIDSEMD